MSNKSVLCRKSLPLIEDHLLTSEWRDPRIGIVHLGIGNFHRAHEAVYTEEAMLAAGGDWAICGVTLQGDVTKRDALMAQDGLYSVVERGLQGVKTIVIRALREVLALPHDRGRLFELLADANVRIVSLTVTEKGYCRDAKTGDVDLGHPGIARDLEHPDEPATGHPRRRIENSARCWHRAVHRAFLRQPFAQRRSVAPGGLLPRSHAR
jgi:fructuronate reductase